MADAFRCIRRNGWDPSWLCGPVADPDCDDTESKATTEPKGTVDATIDNDCDDLLRRADCIISDLLHRDPRQPVLEAKRWTRIMQD